MTNFNPQIWIQQTKKNKKNESHKFQMQGLKGLETIF